MLDRRDEASKHVAEPTLHARTDVLPTVRAQHPCSDVLRLIAAERPSADTQEILSVRLRLALQDPIDRRDQFDQLVDRSVTLLDVFSRQTEVVADVDRVVIRTHGVADDALYHALGGRVPQLLRVGDAVAARWADRAIFDGHMAGREV